MTKERYSNGIPVSPTLNILQQKEGNLQEDHILKKRLLRLSFLAVGVAVLVSLIARLLVYLIDLVTNISFFGTIRTGFSSPAHNHLGPWVIAVPVVGGIIVGFMALYGSKAIRGHGIPEAMEQILVNQSRIKPSITLLKPLSSAIAIGTGGPFGAEGPIIATGGALGSTLGQLLRVTPRERKVILAAGATAGMSAIFGTPIAAISLAIELLLFEFSPWAILPVALACITGAAGHHLLFENGPVFPMPDVAMPSNLALGIYSAIGLVIGFCSLGLTKIVYFIEDTFEKLPIHWMWWPAIGGLAVGIIGYFAPHTLGVGYDNITMVLSGTATFTLVLNLCFFKFLSWAIALGSGTSGGTLAPLLTIGGACGAILGSLVLSFFPRCGLSLPVAALVGMAAMFAGASRAYLTSIIFALEATMQSHALLPLLGGCTASYLVSFFLMKNTIMTEKIARRGIRTPDAYEPDIMDKVTVAQILQEEATVLGADTSLEEVRDFLEHTGRPPYHYFMVVNAEGTFEGVVTVAAIYDRRLDLQTPVSALLRQHIVSVSSNDSLSRALAAMADAEEELIPVRSATDPDKIVGILSYKDIIHAYKHKFRENAEASINLSLKRQSIKVLIKGRRLIKMPRH